MLKKKSFNGLLDTVKPSRGNVGLLTAFSHVSRADWRSH